LRQRIMVRSRTAPLSLEETSGYIQQRLRVAGSPDGAAFSQPAMDAIFFYSGGIPRVVNLICEHSLINAYSEGARPVPPELVEDVVREFRFDEFRPLPARSGDRPAGEVIPMDSTASRMRMSAPAARESAPMEEPVVDAALVAELIEQSAALKASIPAEMPVPEISPIPPEPVAHQIAVAAQVSPPKPTVEPGVPEAPVQSPAIARPAPSPAPPVRSRVVANPAPSTAWSMPRPVANMSWSRRSTAKPIKWRFRATSARLEASVTRIIHKLDELRAVERLQRLAGSSIEWLRQPMRPANSNRSPAGPKQKS
jgi:hypothetical protein